MKENVDPCKDFYKFSCGNFIDNAEIPEGKLRTSVIGMSGDKLEKLMFDELENHRHPYNLKTFEKLNTFYHNCMNDGKLLKKNLRLK